MYPVQTVSSLCVLTLSVLLALRFGRVKADGETALIILKCGDINKLTSPNYPDNYNNNLKIHWDVRVDLAQRIVVTFNDFQTEDSDYLRIEEESYPYARAEYRGSNVATPYLSLRNHLGINFTSDISESRRGFHLSISCLNETDCTVVHEAFEGLEHTRVLTQPVCKEAWHTNVADTVCREAGFPGSYETNFTDETENISESEGMNYQCSKSTFRLQDCRISTSRCIAHNSLVIVCSVSFGFCSEPPEIDNGSWNNTSNGFMYGTTITAKCNDNYELVDGDGKIRCDKATTSTTPDFEWHGTIPSCLKRNTVFPSTTLLPYEPVNRTCESVNYCAIPLYALVPVVVLFTLALISVLVVIVVEFVLWMKRRSKSIDLGSSAIQSQHHA